MCVFECNVLYLGLCLWDLAELVLTVVCSTLAMKCCVAVVLHRFKRFPLNFQVKSLLKCNSHGIKMIYRKCPHAWLQLIPPPSKIYAVHEYEYEFNSIVHHQSTGES